MPLANYQSIPSIRHDYLQGPPDMSSRPGALQQSPLPKLVRGSLADAQSGSIGKAIANVGGDIAKTVGAVSGVLSRLAGKALEDKDDTDGYRAQKMMEVYGLQVKAIEDMYPPEEWMGEKAKLDKKLTEDLQALGIHQSTRDRIEIAGSADGAAIGHGFSSTTSKSMKQDKTSRLIQSRNQKKRRLPWTRWRS